MLKKIIKSPCIGVCSTGIGDSVCRGCKRFAHEVIDWNSYSQDERRLIFTRLNDFLEQVVSSMLTVNDEDALDAFMREQKISTQECVGMYAKVFTLLKAGAQQISSIEVAGCKLHKEFSGWSLVDIRNEIDKNFYALSCAHYERYFPH